MISLATSTDRVEFAIDHMPTPRLLPNSPLQMLLQLQTDRRLSTFRRMFRTNPTVEPHHPARDSFAALKASAALLQPLLAGEIDPMLLNRLIGNLSEQALQHAAQLEAARRRFDIAGGTGLVDTPAVVAEAREIALEYGSNPRLGASIGVEAKLSELIATQNIVVARILSSLINLAEVEYPEAGLLGR